MGQRKKSQDIRKYFKLNYNENIAYQNLWDTANTVLRRKFIAFKCLDKERIKECNHLSFYSKPKKEEQSKSKVTIGRK